MVIHYFSVAHFPYVYMFKLPLNMLNLQFVSGVRSDVSMVTESCFLQRNVNWLLLRFRTENTAVMCDVEQMLHSFHVNPCHRDFMWPVLLWSVKTQRKVREFFFSSWVHGKLHVIVFRINPVVGKTLHWLDRDKIILPLFKCSARVSVCEVISSKGCKHREWLNLSSLCLDRFADILLNKPVENAFLAARHHSETSSATPFHNSECMEINWKNRRKPACANFSTNYLTFRHRICQPSLSLPSFPPSPAASPSPQDYSFNKKCWTNVI